MQPRGLAARRPDAPGAWQAAPADPAVRAQRAEVYARRSAAETSLMARSIFAAAIED